MKELLEQRIVSLDDLKIDSDNEVISVNTSPYRLPLRRKDFPDEKFFNKFVKKCKSIVRSSTEYNDWREYLGEVLNSYNCSITGEESYKTTIEIHHHPYSLETIVKCVIKSYLIKEMPFSTFDICSDIIKLHYDNKIGFIPLVASLHEKFHNGYLELPMELVKGNYLQFHHDYSKYLDEEDQSTINNRFSVNKENCGWVVLNWVKNGTDNSERSSEER